MYVADVLQMLHLADKQIAETPCVWVQVVGCLAATVRLVLTQRLLSSTAAKASASASSHLQPPGKEMPLAQCKPPSTSPTFATPYGSTSVPNLPRAEPHVKLKPRTGTKKEAHNVDDISVTTIDSSSLSRLLPGTSLRITVVRSASFPCHQAAVTMPWWHHN